MKRSKAFILVEILTGMALQAGFILVLCTSFYLMLSFYTRTQQYLNARQKGEKVIAYVDSRIRNAGLGLGKCSSSGEVRDALYRFSAITIAHQSGPKHYLTLPVAVTEGNTSSLNTSSGTPNPFISQVKKSGNKLTGNILTLLYAQRASDYNFTIRTIESPDDSGYYVPITVSQDEKKVGFVTGSGGTDDYKNNNCKFSKDTSSRRTVFSSYTVMAGAGKPICIKTYPDNNGYFNLELQSNTSSGSSVEVCPGDELLYLKCERMFVEAQNFKFWQFETISWDNEKVHSNELGILEVYFELDIGNNILDMYVLASGGFNDAGNTQKPASWPYTWKSEYANYIVYVSRASWKINNLPSGFTWDF